MEVVEVVTAEAGTTEDVGVKYVVNEYEPTATFDRVTIHGTVTIIAPELAVICACACATTVVPDDGVSCNNKIASVSVDVRCHAICTSNACIINTDDGACNPTANF